MASRSIGIEKDLECPVCLEVFKSARYLSCLHTFCEKCIEDVSHGGTVVVCPECRQETVIDERKRAPGLKPNIVVNRLVETLTALKATRDDSIKSIDGHQMCSSHTQYARKYYCKRCRALICSECSMEHHHDHAPDVSLADAIVEERKSFIGGFLKNSEDELRRIEETRRVIAEQREEGTRLLSAASDVKTRLDESFASIRYHKQEMLEQLGSIRLRQERLVNRRVVINQFAKDLLECGNEEELITMYPEWSEAAEDISTMQTSPDTSLQTDDTRIVKELDDCLLHLGQLASSLKELRNKSIQASSGVAYRPGATKVTERSENVSNRAPFGGSDSQVGSRQAEARRKFATEYREASQRPASDPHQQALLQKSRNMPLNSLDAPPDPLDISLDKAPLSSTAPNPLNASMGKAPLSSATPNPPGVSLEGPLSSLAPPKWSETTMTETTMSSVAPPKWTEDDPWWSRGSARDRNGSSERIRDEATSVPLHERRILESPPYSGSSGFSSYSSLGSSSASISMGSYPQLHSTTPEYHALPFEHSSQFPQHSQARPTAPPVQSTSTLPPPSTASSTPRYFPAARDKPSLKQSASFPEYHFPAATQQTQSCQGEVPGSGPQSSIQSSSQTSPSSGFSSPAPSANQSVQRSASVPDYPTAIPPNHPVGFIRYPGHIEPQKQHPQTTQSYPATRTQQGATPYPAYVGHPSVITYPSNVRTGYPSSTKPRGTQKRR